MSRPLVTAVIPVYNRAWCVERAIASVAAQSWRPLELIVVDDGSTDETPVAIRKAQERLIQSDCEMRVLRQENRGVGAARNAAIARAKGDYVALLDSDDEWLPEKTAKQIADLRETRRLINQTEERWVRRGKTVHKPAKFDKTEGDLFLASLDRCAISPSAVMMRRCLIESVGGFDESLPACEDYEMWLRVTCRFEVGLVSEPLLIKYGGHDDQLSFAIPALDRYRIQSLAKLLQTVELSPKRRQSALDALRTKCRIYSIGCRKRGRREEAERILALPDRVDSP